MYYFFQLTKTEKTQVAKKIADAIEECAELEGNQYQAFEEKAIAILEDAEVIPCTALVDVTTFSECYDDYFGAQVKDIRSTMIRFSEQQYEERNEPNFSSCD